MWFLRRRSIDVLLGFRCVGWLMVALWATLEGRSPLSNHPPLDIFFCGAAPRALVLSLKIFPIPQLVLPILI